MEQSHNVLKRTSWPLRIGLALGLAACTSGAATSSEGSSCNSPPAVSRPVAYSKALQGDRRTWGSIVAHVDEQFEAYHAYRFGFTDPNDTEHLSDWAPSATVAQYPDQLKNGSDRSFRVLFKIGHATTVLTLYGLGTEGQPACYTAPKTQFGVNGNQGQETTGPVEVQPPSQPPVGAYPPYWPPRQGSNSVPAVANTAPTFVAGLLPPY